MGYKTKTGSPSSVTLTLTVREWFHEPEHLPSPNDAKLMLVAYQPGTIVVVRERFGGVAAVLGGG